MNIQKLVDMSLRTVGTHRLGEGDYTRWLWQDEKQTRQLGTNEYGCALVLDANGVLVKIYDGANLGYWTADGKATAHFTVKTYASVAFEELQEGETLIIFPNDGGTNGGTNSGTNTVANKCTRFTTVLCGCF